MAISTYTQVGFNSGEVTPRLGKRIDLEKYYRSVRKLENFTPLPQGPAERRKGLRFVREVKNSDQRTRLIPFVFNTIDSYVMEFGVNYIRFYRTQDILTNAEQNISGVTQANPAVVTYVGADTYANGDFVLLDEIVGMTELNNNIYEISNVNVGANTFELVGVNSTGYSAYASGGVVKEIYEISSPYGALDLQNIKYVQDGNVMYLTCGGSSIRPQKIIRNSDGTFTLAALENVNGPVENIEQNTITLTASATTGTITLTASSSLFESGHIGGVWEIRDNSNTESTKGYVRITGYTNATTVTASVQSALFGTTASGYWARALWDGVKGYPSCVAFHEQRLVFGGTNAEPLSVYFSKSNANYEDYEATGSTITPELSFTIFLAGQKNNLEWMVSDTNFLVAGTAGGIAFIGSSNSAEAIGPNNVQVRNGESYGSSGVQGILFGDGIKYIQARGRKLYNAVYDDISLKYRVNDLSLINDEIIGADVLYMDYQVEPYEILYIVAEGRLVSYVIDDTNEVKGFAKYTTKGSFKSVARIPSLGKDQIWVITSREINGTNKRYVEYFEYDDSLDYYVDAGIEYNGAVDETLTLSATSGSGVTATAGAPVFSSSDIGRKILAFDNGSPIGRATITGYTSSLIVTIDIQAEFESVNILENNWFLSATELVGLSHLEGEKVQVNVDGWYAGEYTVSSGAITLPDNKAGGLIYIGIPYNSDLEIMSIESGSETGSAVSKLKRINRVGLSVYKSNGFKFGRSFDNLKQIPSRSGSGLMDAMVSLYGDNRTEDLVRAFNGSWTRDGTICIRQDLPVALTLVSLTAYMETSDN